MRQTEEIWKSIKDFSDYEVSNLGRVRSYKSHWRDPYILKASISTGYCQIRLFKQGKCFSFLAHHLVLEAFIGPCPDGCESNHKDGVKRNNKDDNLEWTTHGENLAHAYSLGLMSKAGERHSHAKLRDIDILEIRRLAMQNIKQTVIALKFSVSQAHVSHIIRRRVWNHI